MASPMMQGGIAQHQGGHAQHGVPLVIAQHAQPYIPSTVSLPLYYLHNSKRIARMHTL